MAPLLDSTARHAEQIGLAKAAIVALVALAIVVTAAVAFGWTLPAGPAFQITPDPAGGLPF